jgi:deazaflavin-dependent oxidoreductase (nitroreductase family)
MRKVAGTRDAEFSGMDLKTTNRRVIQQFRAGGEIPGMHRERLVLLTTVGAKSGRRHTTPMMFHRDGDRILVMASNSGDPRIPDWYRNAVANPEVKVEVGDETYEAAATPLEGDEYKRTWATITKLYPFFAAHRKSAGRPIPIVALERRAPVPRT